MFLCIIQFSSFEILQSRLTAPTSASKRRGSVALGDVNGESGLTRAKSININTMMRTNNAMRRFKQSSKSFKARGSLAPKSALVKKVEEPEEIIDVNWTLDD